jgi:ATP/maltotriose-dependent transcriptional regulator MalT
MKALGAASVLARKQGDLDRARTAAEEGLRLSAETGITVGHDVAYFTIMLGLLALLTGDSDRATKLAERGLALGREANDAECIGDSILLLAHASSRRGDHEQARDLLEEGMALSREWRSSSLLSVVLTDLGWICLHEGDTEQATTLFEEAAALSKEQRGEEFLIPLHSLGWAALVGRDLQRAKALHKDSLELCYDLGDKGFACYCLEGLACVAEAEGEAKRAARLFGAAEALRQAIGITLASDKLALVEMHLVGARSQLEEPEWEAAFAEGGAMTTEEAVAYGLSGEQPHPTVLPASERGPVQESPALTSREEEVASLVARGFSNRRIASELHISEHTAATHVRRILKKLGFRSRAQIGSWFTEGR